MVISVLRKIRSKIARLLYVVFGVEIDPVPVNLAQRVAGRVLEQLTPRERSALRQRFGVDLDTDMELEKIAAQFAKTGARLREIEAMALIRLYRWEHRKPRSPAVQRRIARRVGRAHEAILEALCDAPPISGLLLEWHDALVAGSAGECDFARLPEPTNDNAKEPPEPPERTLARTLRKAMWAHARARRATNDREIERKAVLEALRDARISTRGISELADQVLRLARHISVEEDKQVRQLLDPIPDPDPPLLPVGERVPEFEAPDFDKLDPHLAIALEAESGMTVRELRRLARTVEAELDKARSAVRLLVDAGMPLVAEIVDTTGVRGAQFLSGVQIGRAALLRAADGFCFLDGEDYPEYAEQAMRRALLGNSRKN